MKKFILYVAAYLGLLIFTTFGATAIHEQGHLLAAKYIAGITGGYVDFTLYGGTFYYPEGSTITFTQDVIVSIAGGLFTVLLALPAWLFLWWTPSKWDLALEGAYFSVIFPNLMYAGTEITNGLPGFWGETFWPIAKNGSVAIGVAIAVVWYLPKIYKFAKYLYDHGDEEKTISWACHLRCHVKGIPHGVTHGAS